MVEARLGEFQSFAEFHGYCQLRLRGAKVGRVLLRLLSQLIDHRCSKIPFNHRCKHGILLLLLIIIDHMGMMMMIFFGHRGKSLPEGSLLFTLLATTLTALFEGCFLPNLFARVTILAPM